MLKYNTNDHPKANGLSLTIEYPSTWRREEGNRTHIVQKFVLDMPSYSVMSFIQVQPTPIDGNIDQIAAEEFFGSFEELGSVSNIRSTKIENEPAYMADVFVMQERAGMKVSSRQRYMVLLYKRRMIFLQCGVFGLPSDMLAEFNRHVPDCNLFFNSFVLNSKWERAPSGR
jgi:hypothetical protein